MVDLVYCLTNLLFFDIPLLYYYINLRSLIILSFFWRYISFFRYFFIMLICNCFWIILLWIFWIFCNPISNFITNQISCFCCFFWIAIFEAVLNASLAYCLAWSRWFWLYLLLRFLPMFLPIFLPLLLAKGKNVYNL